MNNKFIEEFLLDQTIRIYEGLRTHLINEGINDEDTEELTENTEETQKLLEDVNDKVNIIMDALGLEDKIKEDNDEDSKSDENNDNGDTDVFMVPDDNDEEGNIFTVPAMNSVDNNDNEIAKEPGNNKSPDGESLVHGGRYILNLYSSDGRVKIKENLLFNSLSRLLDYNNNGLFPITYSECERVLKRDRILSSGKLFTNSRIEIIKKRH